MDWSPFVAPTLAAAAVIVASYFGFRGTRGTNKVASESARFDDNLALAEYVDKRIAAAIAPLQTELGKVREALAAVQLRERSLKDIVRRWFQRLTFWDDNGRAGEMPVPSPEDMRILELVELAENSMPRVEVTRLIENNPT